MTTASTHLVALLGHPVSHSRSPSMMTHAFAQLGVDAAYLACDVAPQDLPAAVRGLHALGAVGANVTVPHKQSVLALCARVSPAAAAIGAANTLVREAEGFTAHNTDAPGAIDALTDEGVTVRGARMVVLGAGGAARAVAVGAALAGAAEVALVARTPATATAIADAVAALGTGCDTKVVPWREQEAVRAVFADAAIAVQATTVGMASAGPRAERAGMEAWLTAMPAGATAMDLVYQPRETAWLAAARTHGLRAIDGLGMLAHQGARALQHWFGASVPAAELRRFLDATGAGG